MKLGDLSKKQSENKEINISPLIDIIFILLIFFIVTTTFKKDQKFEIPRPEAKTGKNLDSFPLKVFVEKDGKAFIDGSQINPWVFQKKVRDKLQFISSKKVYIIAHRDIRGGKLVDLVDQCNLAGAKEVGVAVSQK